MKREGAQVMSKIVKMSSHTPRIPAAQDVNRSEYMLCLVLCMVVSAVMAGIVVWAVMR